MFKNAANEKTVMCLNINKPGGCKFGHSCRYAHEIDELVIKKCDYGTECIFVKYKEDGVFNDKTKNKICMRKHPDETNESCLKRVDVKNSESERLNWTNTAVRNKHEVRYDKVKDKLLELIENGDTCFQLYIDYTPENII